MAHFLRLLMPDRGTQMRSLALTLYSFTPVSPGPATSVREVAQLPRRRYLVLWFGFFFSAV